MIKQFDTSFSAPSTNVGSSGGSSGGSKTIITVLVVLAVAYLGYKFVVKPMLDKNKSVENDSENEF